jgi:hypothetical protein
MKPLITIFFALSTFAAEPLAQKGERLFSDDFERSDLGEWKTVIPSFAVQNGVLKGWQTRDDHGAVGRIYKPSRTPGTSVAWPSRPNRFASAMTRRA